MLTGRRKILSGVLAQGVASLSNLLVALVVARALGASALGRFSLLIAALGVLTALQTSWVGDSLTVLGPEYGRAALWWQHIIAISGSAVAAGLAVLLLRVPLSEAAAFTCLVAAWLYEEYGRRCLMARLRFVAQGLNDLLYLGLSLGGLTAFRMLGMLDLTAVLWAMAASAAVASVASQLHLPPEIRYWARSVGAGQQEVLAVRNYGSWRSAQAATGAAGGLATRSVVSAGASLTVLGNLELARLVTAPLLTALAGMANVLLPVAANQRREGTSHRGHRASLLLLGMCAAYSALLLWQLPRAVRVLGGDGFSVSEPAVVGWLLVAVVLAATQQLSVRGLVELPARHLFIIRSAGTVVAVIVTAGLVQLSLADWTPFALVAGTVVTAAGLRRRLHPRPPVARASDDVAVAEGCA